MKEVYQNRSQLKNAIRQFFELRDFVEVDTPILVQTPGTEIHLDYFASAWVSGEGAVQECFLRSSPELHLKKLVAQGLHRIYEFAPCFRNHGELGPWHHPEFTMLEWYETAIGFSDFMAETQDLVLFCQDFEFSKKKLPQSFNRISVFEAFEEFVGIGLVDGDPELALKGVSIGIPSLTGKEEFETAFFKILLDQVEPELKKQEAVFLYDYPPSQASLAVVEKNVAKRFELYLGGIEICNAYFELRGGHGNFNRFLHVNDQRKKNGKPEIAIDQQFIEAMETSMSPFCGNALGFDRLLAVLTNSAGIRSVSGLQTSHLFQQSHSPG